MNRVIRKNVFETNSSSTHSLCIKPEGWEKYDSDCDFDSPYIVIEYKDTLNSKWNGKTAIIKTSNYYKRGSGYFLIEGDLQKIQFIASCMSQELNTLHSDLNPNQIEPFKMIYKAIHKYLKDKYDIPHTKIEIYKYYGNGSFIEQLVGWSWKEEIPFTNDQILEIVTEVISNDSIVFTCHSDESGPFPDEIGLEQIEDLNQLLKK